MERKSVTIGQTSFRVERRASWEHLPVISGESTSDSHSPDTAKKEAKTANKKANKRLFKAIDMFESHEEIEQAIKDGADVNVKDKKGEFPLTIIDRPYLVYGITEQLIRHNVDVNAQNKEGKTALQFHLQKWHDKMDRVAYLLLKAGADMNIKDCKGTTAWHVLVENGYEYCGSFRQCNYESNAEMYGDDHSMFLEILKYQSDINARDGKGRTALHIAGKLNDFDLVRILTEHGADPNAMDDNGSKPLHEAIGNFGMTKAMLGAGAAVDFSNPGEVSRLHIRLLESHLKYLPLFIEPHTVNSPGVFNRTILHLAASLGCHQHIKYLLAISEINVNAKDIFGTTCLHFATQIGATDIIDDLLCVGADIDVLNEFGQSLCHVAAINGHFSPIELFTHRGLSPNTVDNKGRNCLHYAVIYRHAKLVERLLKVNVDSELKDCKEKKPRDYLLECENNSIIAQLLRRETPVIYILSADADPPFDQASRDVPHLAEIPAKPGIGSVKKLKDFDMPAFVALIKGKVDELIREAIPELPVIQVLGCGSSFEGSKVAIPDELDFIVELFTFVEERRHLEHRLDDGEYEIMEPSTRIITDNMSYLVRLWEKLMMWWSKQQEAAKSQPGESVPQLQMPLPPQRHPDRSSCITWVWLYNDAAFQDFSVSIDFVPAARDFTFNCYVVPKTPKEGDEDRKTRKRGRVSHPPFEVKYLRSLDERVLNVYITAKCLRDPDVCGFKIKDEDGDIVPVKEFISSYMLKTAFMHLAPAFQDSELSHGKMVLMVYKSLEKGIEQKNLPSFFLERLNVLVGSHFHPELSLLAATKMTKFVRFLYERDFPEERRLRDSLQEQNVWLRIKVDLLMKVQKDKVKLPFYLPPAIDRPTIMPDSTKVEIFPDCGMRRDDSTTQRLDDQIELDDEIEIDDEMELNSF